MKNLTWQNPEQLFVAQELINKVKSKCCGIKVEIGNPVYPPARRKLAEHGISCDGHAARQLTNQDYDKSDLLIGMDSANPVSYTHLDVYKRQLLIL